ncbi:MAG TPA: hypothetical protein VL961_07190 [Acidimicrobiales bacterium]|nr:hypothetical protein [Acidimicrobiales bacterium]
MRATTRPGRRRAGLSGLLAAGVALSLSAAGAPAGAATSAATLYREALRTADGWSVHYESETNFDKTPVLESGDAGPASGTQVVLVRSGSTTDQSSIVVIGGLTYIRANVSALEDMIGFTQSEAQAANGQWIVFSSSNASFSAIVAGVRSHDVLQEVEIQGPYSLGATRTLDGVRVDAIDGTQKLQGQKRMKVVLYVRADGSHVLVEEDSLGAKGRTDGLEHIVFSKWGEQVRPHAPQATITLGNISTT